MLMRDDLDVMKGSHNTYTLIESSSQLHLRIIRALSFYTVSSVPSSSTQRNQKKILSFLIHTSTPRGRENSIRFYSEKINKKMDEKDRGEKKNTTQDFQIPHTLPEALYIPILMPCIR